MTARTSLVVLTVAACLLTAWKLPIFTGFDHRLEAPPKINNLEASKSAEDVSLSWDRPDTKCPITDYIITYKGVAKWRPHTEHNGNASVGCGDATNFTINGLLPDTEYAVEVAAANENGKGKPEYIFAATAEGVPSKPTELKSISSSSSTITITWETPTEANGVVTNYSVSWYDDGRIVGKATVPYLTHTITGLSPCVEYTMRVAANTGAGEGEGEEVTRTTVASLPNVANAFCTIAPDAQEVTVTWSMPYSTCIITGYEFSWQYDTEQPFASINAFTAGPELSYTAKMTSKQHNTVCVAAILEEEHGQRTCCVKILSPNHSGSEWWHRTLLTLGIVVVAAPALVLWILLLRKLLGPRQNRRQKAWHLPFHQPFILKIHTGSTFYIRNYN